MIELLSIAYRTASREELWSGTGSHLYADPDARERFEERKRRYNSLPQRRSLFQKLLGKARGSSN
jgi:hypothetical protein